MVRGKGARIGRGSNSRLPGQSQARYPLNHEADSKFSKNIVYIEGWKEDLTVKEIMETKLITISPDTPTGEAIEIMAKKNIGCLPVVSENRLIGLVTERIIVNATAMTKKFKREW